MLRAVVIFSAIGLVAAPAAAATYSAKPVVPTTKRIIARDIVWNCGPAACQGSTEDSRPAVLCQSLAKKAGKIESFAVDGRMFAPAELERCNAAAGKKSDSALAAQ
jgi:hypothetical protein